MAYISLTPIMGEDPKPRFRYSHALKRLVRVCEPGVARGYNEFSNRGLEGPEITVWPRREHHKTTGYEWGKLGIPEPVRLNGEQQRMAAILGLSPEELGIFLLSWMPKVEGGVTGQKGMSIKPPETIEQIRHELALNAPPPDGYVKISEASREGLSESSINYARCKGTLTAVEVGGIWYVDKQQVAAYRDSHPRRHKKRNRRSPK